MSDENRQNPRYQEIGKVAAPELCPLPGILDDISLEGCKIHYTFPIVADLENEYELKISPVRHNNSSPLKLICVPQWVNEKDGHTYIGFKINYSPDQAKLKEFIKHLTQLATDNLPEIV